MASSRRAAREQAIYESLVYPDGHVLRNKFGITEQTLLDKMEAKAAAVREPTRPIFRKFDLKEMQAARKHMLADIYEWAGKLRTYTTGRSEVASFARPEYIESCFESQIFKPLRREKYLEGNSGNNLPSAPRILPARSTLLTLSLMAMGV